MHLGYMEAFIYNKLRTVLTNAALVPLSGCGVHVAAICERDVNNIEGTHYNSVGFKDVLELSDDFVNTKRVFFLMKPISSSGNINTSFGFPLTQKEELNVLQGREKR